MKGKPNFTPWIIVQCGPMVAKIVDAGGLTIAKVDLVDSETAEKDSRANLIAAAPELLSVLKRIEERVKYCAPGEEIFTLQSIGNEARAAIEKADYDE